MALRGFAERRVGPGADFIERLAASGRQLGRDAAALAAFTLASHAALDLLMPAPDFARAVGQSVIDGLFVFGLYAAGGRFLLAPGSPERRLLPLPRAEWHWRMLLLYAVAGPLIVQTVSLGRQAGGDPAGVAGWFLIVGALITLQKLWWFWVGRRDVRTMILGEPGAPTVPVQRVAAVGLPWLFMGVAVLIFLVARVAAVSPEGARWAAAAGMTQIAAILLPAASAGVGAVVRALRARRGLVAPLSPLAEAGYDVARVLAKGAVWILGLGAVAQIWGLYLLDPGSAGALEGLRSLTRVAMALVVGWVIWTFMTAYFDAHAPRTRSALPGDEDEAEPGVQSRLATVLPLVRNLALGAVIAVTGLVVLSGLGVDIGPLLAGFGVIGLAISFGSQALVRDIVSGIFFMADDAFRVGEYIDTGKLKGTVEKITLRSVQLRHQNGQIHTVPFGQLQSTTNFSRDWATMKFSLRLDREADIEKARKTIKKVGQQMLEDPELGPEFLLPLKMQGVQEIQDAAIVVRLKFTCKPTKPTYLQREALKRVYRALNEAGVPLASNAVTVRGGEPDMRRAAAALPHPVPAVAAE